LDFQRRTSGLSGFSALDFRILAPSDFGRRKCHSPTGGGLLVVL
jgi:hypothetical protein